MRTFGYDTAGSITCDLLAKVSADIVAWAVSTVSRVFRALKAKMDDLRKVEK